MNPASVYELSQMYQLEQRQPSWGSEKKETITEVQMVSTTNIITNNTNYLLLTIKTIT